MSPLVLLRLGWIFSAICFSNWVLDLYCQSGQYKAMGFPSVPTWSILEVRPCAHGKSLHWAPPLGSACDSFANTFGDWYLYDTEASEGTPDNLVCPWKSTRTSHAGGWASPSPQQTCRRALRGPQFAKIFNNFHLSTWSHLAVNSFFYRLFFCFGSDCISPCI